MAMKTQGEFPYSTNRAKAAGSATGLPTGIRGGVRQLTGSLALFVALLLLPQAAAARPTYFETLTSTYNIAEESRLHGCGLCHNRWTGTGQRNPFGLAVQQHLYAGKTIGAALAATESLDSDGDGTNNLDELTLFMTLPGFSCVNFENAVGFPSGFDTFVTPAVPTCLDPIDLDLSVAAWSFVANLGKTSTLALELINHGATLPINISSVELLPGAHPSVSILASAAPFSIPVGGRSSVLITFAPEDAGFATATLRVESDDPDEPIFDVAFSGIGVPRNLAELGLRRDCRKQVDRAFASYSRTHLREWSRCTAREAQGVDCGGAQRDFKIVQAKAALREAVGGARDRACQGAGLNPALAGYEASCAESGACADLTVTGFASFATCLVCRQDAATATLLDAAIDQMPPDLPAALPLPAAACARQLLPGLERAVGKLRGAIAACGLETLDAVPAVDCAAATAEDAAALQAQMNRLVGRCGTPEGMPGCEFGGDAVAGCLATAADSVARSLLP